MCGRGASGLVAGQQPFEGVGAEQAGKLPRMRLPERSGRARTPASADLSRWRTLRGSFVPDALVQVALILLAAHGDEHAAAQREQEGQAPAVAALVLVLEVVGVVRHCQLRLAPPHRVLLDRPRRVEPEV